MFSFFLYIKEYIVFFSSRYFPSPFLSILIDIFIVYGRFTVVITLDSKDTLHSWQNEAHRIE